MTKSFRRVKAACYMTNMSMSVVGNLSPLLFLTFHTRYGISYSLLGLLVLLNFCTQLAVDLIFSFFSHRFNIEKTVKITPVITVVGLWVFALLPQLFPTYAYLGIVIGTLIFSASSGLCEVLISPTIAAIPAENPEREMSKLHSIYAWGVVGTVLLATLFLTFVGTEYWHVLALLFSLVPFSASVLYFKAEMPKMETPERTSGALRLMKNKALWLCVLAIFLGGAAECTMAQWASGYLEMALGIPKLWGDVFGVALFAATLGLGRSLYAKIGKNVERVLLFGAIGAALCYLIAAFSPIPLLGLIACALTGLCVSMLWPGSLIIGSERFPAGGVFIFALMAAGGDFGASVGPQLVGIVTDAVAASGGAMALAERLGISAEQLGMRFGMLIGALFPLIAIAVYVKIYRDARKKKKQTRTSEVSL
jgi:fucose permease